MPEMMYTLHSFHLVLMPERRAASRLEPTAKNIAARGGVGENKLADNGSCYKDYDRNWNPQEIAASDPAERVARNGDGACLRNYQR